ncbi:MAG: type II toxin-antitoxin system VapC family toxin [Chloroflexota bacterium]
MARYLLDTGLVIQHLRGKRPIVQLLRALGKTERFAISAVTRLEIHAGMKPDERYATQKLLSRFLTLDLNRQIADQAGDLIRERETKGQNLGVPDAIIAATGVAHGLTLITLNRADFDSIPGLSLFPFPD